MVYSDKIIKLANNFEQKILKYSRDIKKDNLIKLLKIGIDDSQLDYLRSGMRNMKPFYDAYTSGIRLGFSPNQIATGIPYNKSGDKFPPIAIDIEDNGKMYLVDGRHRYKAAREYGADNISSKIRQYDSDGNVIFEVVEDIKLI